MGASFSWHSSRAVAIAFALLLAIVEFLGVIGNIEPSPAALMDAFCSGALVYALFASVFIFSGLVPVRGVHRVVWLVACHLLVAVAALVLFSSWAFRWLLGEPLNQDGLEVLLESPVAALLHLNESSQWLVGSLAAAMLGFLYLCARVLNQAARAWSGGYVAPRAIIAAACVVVGGLSSWGVATAGLSWSSYASVVSDDGYDGHPDTYTCSRPQPAAITPVPVGTPKGVPVIVVVLESLRADVLSKHPDAMPFLAQLSKESLVFEKAYAPATHSDFADIAIWYSRYPLFAERRLGYPVDAPWRGISAFDYFKASGYRTGYFSSQNETWGEMANWMDTPAIEEFFDARESSKLTAQGKVPDHHTLEQAGDWAVARAREPFLLGLNLQNTHDSYVIPKGGPQPFQPAASGKGDFMYAWPAERAPLVFNRYLNAAYNVDVSLAKFAQRLRDAGVWDRSIVLFVGDHGEAFHEHGLVSHAGPPFEETARVLAMLKLPKGHQHNGRVHSGVVSSIDFVPMLGELSGLPAWQGFQGSSPLAAGASSGPKFITVNARTRGHAIVKWPWKLISSTFPEREVALYNLETDPQETRDLQDAEPAMARQLAAELGEWRTCQLSYYADSEAHTRFQPPRY